MLLESKSIRLRYVEVDDAAFILKLRLDERYNLFLSSVNANLQAQKDWISGYKGDEKSGKQYYFIIELLDGTPCGTIRVYDLNEESFCWGSWILNENKTRYAALESAFLVYKFGFEKLGYSKSHFEVMKANSKVISFHEKMGAKKLFEDADNIYFNITSADVESARKKLADKVSLK